MGLSLEISKEIAIIAHEACSSLESRGQAFVIESADEFAIDKEKNHQKLWLATASLFIWTGAAHLSVEAAEHGEAWYNGARISAGLQVRTWEANFRATDLDAPPARGMRPRDVGFRGLYPGEGDIEYKDGSIIANPDFWDGLDHFTVQNQDQIRPSPHLDGDDFYQITFSSLHVDRPRTSSEALDSSGSSEETVLVPFVLLELPAMSNDEGWAVYGALRYAFGRGSIDRSPRQFSQTVHQQRTERNQYIYDANFFGGEITAPFDSRDHDPNSAIVTDAEAFLAANPAGFPYQSPTQQSAQSVQRQSYAGWSAHEIDIEQHELLLGGSAELSVADRLSIGVLAGVTISYVDWTLKTDAWFTNAAGEEVQRQRFSRSSNEWLWGATCQVQARVDVTEDGRYFAVLDAGYNWVNDFNTRNDVSSARVQLDSWVVSGAVGLRL